MQAGSARWPTLLKKAFAPNRRVDVDVGWISASASTK